MVRHHRLLEAALLEFLPLVTEHSIERHVHAKPCDCVKCGMRTLFPLLLLGAAALQPLPAQDPASDNIYRLDFTVHETNVNQPAKDRHYSLLVQPNSWGKIMAGNKVPYMTEKDKFSYADVGVMIDCRLQERNTHLFLDGKFELSSTVPGGNLPQIQSFRSDMTGTVEPGKPTRLVALDDPMADRHYEIEVVATKM